MSRSPGRETTYKVQAAVWLIQNGERQSDVLADLGLSRNAIYLPLKASGHTDKRWRNGGDRVPLNQRHGTPNRYADGCRCRPCTDANTRRVLDAKARRVERFRRGEIHPEHGTRLTYANYDCRCDPCRDAWSDHMKHRYDPQEGNIRRACCPYCSRMIAIRLDGTFRAHRNGDRQPCWGSKTATEGLAA